MSLHIAHRRQYERRAVDLPVRVTISPDCASQVAPQDGATIAGRLSNISAGGAHVVAPTFLPRGTRVTLELPPEAAVPAAPPGAIRACVIKTAMVDREPRYGLGLRFEAGDGEAVRAWCAAEADLPAVAGRRDRGPQDQRANDTPAAAGQERRNPAGAVSSCGRGNLGLGIQACPPGRAGSQSHKDLPEWLAQLQCESRVEGDVLQTALRDSGGDAQRAGAWLVEHGCVGQRELTLVQAECLGVPFVEPGEFRINLDNRAVLSEELARGHEVFPLFVIDRVITLAVRWPLQLPALDQIRLTTNHEVDQCLVCPRDLRHLIECAYGSFQEQDKAPTAEAIAWEEILRDVADAPAVKLVNVLLDQAAACRASDVHLDPEEHALRVRFRVDGLLREVPAPPKELLPAIVSRIKVLARMDIAETRRPQDGHFRLAVERQEVEVRVSTLPAAGGEAVVLRLLHGAGQLLSLEDLGMDPLTRDTFDRLIHLPHGMLLVTGPTGSGKTTTLYSALTRIDRVRQSLVTLEEPVEIRLPAMRQVSVNPKAGLTFLSGLRAILRQDPDVIMIGEIRDQETAETALQAALTGHLMLSTLHTNSAAAAPARLLDMGVAAFLVSSALVGVLAQRLCRCVCQHCARPRPIGDASGSSHPGGLELLPSAAIELLQGRTLLEAVGCKRCGHTGYEGRTGIFELLVVSDDMRRAIMKGADERTLAAMARESGMRLLVEDGLEKVAQGRTTLEELLRVVGRVDLDSRSGRRNRGPQGPAVAGTLPDGRTTGLPESGFDVSAYDRLLRKWLADAQPACTR